MVEWFVTPSISIIFFSFFLNIYNKDSKDVTSAVVDTVSIEVLSYAH